MLLCNAEDSIQKTEQIPNDPPLMGANSTTTSNHPNTSALNDFDEESKCDSDKIDAGYNPDHADE